MEKYIFKDYQKELGDIINVGIARCSAELDWGGKTDPRSLIELFTQTLNARLKPIETSLAFQDFVSFWEIREFLQRCVWDFETKMGDAEKSRAEVRQSLKGIKLLLRVKLSRYLSEVERHINSVREV